MGSASTTPPHNPKLGRGLRVSIRTRSGVERSGGRWVTDQVGRCGRTVNEVAAELRCGWHTVNDAVVAYGSALVDDDPDRIAEVTGPGLDETLFSRQGPLTTGYVIRQGESRGGRTTVEVMR